MKKTILGIVIGVMVLVLAGCADHYPEYLAQAQKTDADNKAMVGSYFAGQAARDSIVLTKMTDPTSLVLYSMLQGQRDASLINAFKGSVVVPPTTPNDIWKVFWGNTAPTIARWGFGYMIASDLLDALGAGMTVGGDYVSVSNQPGGNMGNFNWNDSSVDFSVGDVGDDFLLEGFNDNSVNLPPVE